MIIPFSFFDLWLFKIVIHLWNSKHVCVAFGEFLPIIHLQQFTERFYYFMKILIIFLCQSFPHYDNRMRNYSDGIIPDVPNFSRMPWSFNSLNVEYLTIIIVVHDFKFKNNFLKYPSLKSHSKMVKWSENRCKCLVLVYKIRGEAIRHWFFRMMSDGSSPPCRAVKMERW